jgi:hypothetical protein
MEAGGLAPLNLIQPTISLEMPVPSQGHCGYKVKESQWKCLHNINYTEHRLKKKNEFVKRKMPSLPNKRQ